MKITLDTQGAVTIEDVEPTNLKELLELIKILKNGAAAPPPSDEVVRTWDEKQPPAELSEPLYAAWEALNDGMLTANGVAVQLGIPKATATWRLRRLMDLGVAQRVGRGQYVPVTAS